MKNIIFLLFSLFSLNVFSQGQKIKLIDCIHAAQANKADVQAIKTENEIAGLQSQEMLAKYLPQISLAYEFRNNPIIPSQIVPIGQFNSVITDETRAIKFGTEWQQNAGINLYQPIIDASVKSKISESKINERIKNTDLQIAEQELKYEVIKSFFSVYLKTLQLKNSLIDTIRTFKSLELIKLKFDESKVLKVEVNKASINHNKALSNFKYNISDLVKEKIYLSFLTGLLLSEFLELEYDFEIFEKPGFFEIPKSLSFDSILFIRQLTIKDDLIKRQIYSEKRKHLPTLGLQGFYGANQYSNKFDPFLRNTWYGSSYIGLQVKMPILFSENTVNRIRQFDMQSKGIKFRIEEEQNRLNKETVQLSEDIKYLNSQISFSKQNIELLVENVKLLQERLAEGQINTYDLNSQELELQKEESILNESKTELLKKKLDKINSSGNLNLFINSIQTN